MKRLFAVFMVLAMMAVSAVAQVTTSAIAGVVKADGEEAIGATITARDTRSGAIYRAVTNVDGRYTITGMRAGGPYDVEISYMPAGLKAGIVISGVTVVIMAAVIAVTELMRRRASINETSEQEKDQV